MAQLLRPTSATSDRCTALANQHSFATNPTPVFIVDVETFLRFFIHGVCFFTFLTFLYFTTFLFQQDRTGQRAANLRLLANQ